MADRRSIAQIKRHLLLADWFCKTGECPHIFSRRGIYRSVSGFQGTPRTKSHSYEPYLIVYSGRYNDSSASNRGSSSGNGRYWSSTVNTSNSNNAYNLNFNSSSVNPGTNNNNKYNGYAVRCVAGEIPAVLRVFYSLPPTLELIWPANRIKHLRSESLTIEMLHHAEI